MSNALLTTKLYFPPSRASLVPRPRLVERLQAGLQSPLTLISAPAGSGKTTVLGQWRLGPGAGVPAAWLSLDPADNDPARFLQYLSAALEFLEPGLEEAVQPLLQSAEQPNGEAVLTLLINRLSGLEEESALVLDDYHLIDNPTIHSALTFLLDHLPPRLHLVILSRADPPLPLARLRARGQLTEIRAADLRFSVEEAAEFLNQVMGLGLTGGQVAALEKRTEGWIAGLQLAAISMHGREDLEGFVSTFTGSHHYIVDYLMDEVLGYQTEKLREFLLKTSILERFNSELCDTLTGSKDGESILADLEHANLFIVPLDEDRHWFRYHQLFADLLRNRLLHVQPELISRLHIQASDWFEANGFQDEAINHALQGKDFERAARLICQDELRVVNAHSPRMLDGWLQAFPEAILCSNPWLCIARAHVLFTTGRLVEMVPFISCAEDDLACMLQAGQIGSQDPETLILLGEVYSLRSMLARQQSRVEEALEFAQKAVEIIPQPAHNRAFALSNLYLITDVKGDFNQAFKLCLETIAAARLANYPTMHIVSTYNLTLLLQVWGKLHQAARAIKEAQEYVASHGQAHLFHCGLLNIGLAGILLEWNDLDAMEAELETGLALCRQGGMSVLVWFGLLTQAKLRAARRDFNGALKILDRMERDCKGMDPHVFLEFCASYGLLWKMEQGDLTGLTDWLSRKDLNVEKKIGTDRFVDLALAARFLCALDRCKESMQILEKMEKIAREDEYAGWLVSILVLQAVAWKKMRNEARAVECLEQALELAEPEGYVRVFLDLGQPIYETLRLVQKKGGDSQYVTRLLAAFQPNPPVKRITAADPDHLSQRELDVLKLLAQGCPDKQIAKTLVIARETVHKHLKNIYGKLGVHSRTEAIARAREQGLL